MGLKYPLITDISVYIFTSIHFTNCKFCKTNTLQLKKNSNIILPKIFNFFKMYLPYS